MTSPAHHTMPLERPHAAHLLPALPRRLAWTRQDTYAFLIIGLIAAVTRFFALTGLTASGTPVFDEKHYVPQAWDMVQSQDNPLVGGIESNPGYGLVVHPPLGKRLLAIGETLFGYTPLGWRVMTALFGVITVLLVMAITRRLSGGSQVAFIAGLIAICDGVLLIGSRFGMLDIFQTTFVLAATWALIRDFQQVYARYYQAWRAKGGWGTSTFGPRAGFRWWRFAAGIFLGLALAVKWSGLYYIAFFGLACVIADAWMRRRFGVKRPWVGALLYDAVPAFASLVILAVAVYAFSWRSWFASETAYSRHALSDGTVEQGSWLHLLPEPVAGWLYYHQSVLEFHASLTTSSGHSHPWDSKPWSWLVAGRPILYLSTSSTPCAIGECQRMVYLFGTPAIWWLTIPALLWSAWSIAVRRDYRFIPPLVGFAAGFLPWLAVYDRQMYFFYATALAPYLAILLALWASQLIGRGRRLHSRWITKVAGRPLHAGTITVVVYLALVVAMFFYFGPILYGARIPKAWFDSLMWLPSWR
ncbi:dolichyl-phosphate-mannose--protein mannosyltransferase [Corynebacterium atypicum]|uniref:Polyprenol-phosphate-mannose--protein mannosyltransferase n=2 Tax=Corynebacterium atypicum TaxID=191610 RepID=A0ABN4DCE0_9CORY|nr:dolichyl-phosphate-mannose--protein mannosyltransferase [Corynebacterium atypicum]